MKVETIEIKTGVVARAYTSVGGYPIFYLDREDNVLCPGCALEEETEDEREVVAADVNWESYLTCDECCDVIEMAYPPDEEGS
jgi:hypothetical protein